MEHFYSDSHCHLNDKALNEDIPSVLKRARDAGVKNIIVIAWDLESSKQAIEIAEANENVYATVGFHPENLDDISDEALLEIEKLAANRKVVAIGEIGLDYHWFKEQEHREKQKEWFIRQIELANKLGLPCSIHAREATGDTYTILKEHPIHASAVLHCYSGSSEMLREFAKLGYYFGFDGPVTFKNAKEPKECALVCPLDRLLVETDSPYMAPTPFRGTTNEPKHIPLIVEHIAAIREMEIDDLKGAIEENLQRLFHVEP